ncbi:MAG TPA: Na/Pi cotransporter family protein [Sulfurospirillum arcachonense]|nr:Na/Pi cotransporter family protein [Sulfurospirillum arcachonense]
MLRKMLLPIIFVVLSYGFWISPDFKTIAAGVAIFLFGMVSLEEGFKAFSGGILEEVLEKSTNKLYKSISFGIVTTAIMQSSSLVSVLTISFLGAGLIGLYQGIGIILGANIGTTTGAWLMAGFGLKVKISAYAMPMLVFGVILLFQKAKAFKGIGYILVGLGFLFLGIHYMKEGFETFKDSVDLASLAVPGLKGIFIFIGIGILATIVMQSSHATIVLIIAALAVGQITYENSLALTIGANIGTTITAIIGSLSSNINGKRLAGAHFIFNLITGFIAIFIMQDIMIVVSHISDFIGIASDNYTLKLAVFDTLFKVMGVIMFIPFINKLITLLNIIFKSKKSPSKLDDEIEGVKYLNESVLELPETAIIAITKETKHLYEVAFKIISNGILLKKKNILSSMSVEDVLNDEHTLKDMSVKHEYAIKVKEISGEILHFATQAQNSMEADGIEKIYRLKLSNKYIVAAIKATRHIEKNIKFYTKSRNEHIKEQYNIIRKNLVKLLRLIDSIDIMQDSDDIAMLLSKAKLHVKKYDMITNGTADDLIRKGLITNQMAISLMNDSTYAYEISKNLIDMAEEMFMNKSDQKEHLIMDDDDINEIVSA